MISQGGFIAYYRVSTAKQGASGLGIEAQRAAVANYLNGGDWQIIDEFVEVESGKRADRPELDKALAAARVHRVPVVVAKVDRLTRSVAFLSRLLEAGVDVRFSDLPQIEGPTGQFMLTQMAAVAQLEAGLIAKRTRDALAAAKARGRKLGGHRRALLRDTDNRPMTDANGKKLYGELAVASEAARQASKDSRRAKARSRAADLAPIIAEIRVGGAESLRAIAAALNARGIPTARGRGKWQAAQVARALARL